MLRKGPAAVRKVVPAVSAAAVGAGQAAAQHTSSAERRGLLLAAVLRLLRRTGQKIQVPREARHPGSQLQHAARSARRCRARSPGEGSSSGQSTRRATSRSFESSKNGAIRARPSAFQWLATSAWPKRRFRRQKKSTTSPPLRLLVEAFDVDETGTPIQGAAEKGFSPRLRCQHDRRCEVSARSDHGRHAVQF